MSERVLVVPFADGIGDFVMMLPLLGAIRRRYPEATITVAASPRASLLLDESQAAAFRIRTPSWLRSAPRPRGGPFRKLVPQTAIAAVAGVALRLELGRFDRTLNLFRWWEHGMDFRRYWTPHVPARPGAVHTLDCLAERLGQELGQPIPLPARAPRMTVRRDARRWANEWWWRSADGPHRPVVGLVPASNMHIKRWPTHAWVRLSGALRDAGCVPLVLLPPGRDPLERALEATPVPPLIVRAPLDRAAALLARCDLVVGVDTGLLHLAAALGTRYVGLFGPTNPLVTGPYDGSLGTTLVAPVEKTDDCASCWRQFKYVEDHCQAMPAGSCMAALSVESVLDACIVELARLSSAA